MSRTVNKVIVLGNVGATPEVREVGEKKVANFSVATSPPWKQDETEWHRIVAWSPLAEIVEKYVDKGTKVYIDGRIRTRSYEGTERRVFITEIIAENIVLLGGSDVPATVGTPDGSGGDDETFPF